MNTSQLADWFILSFSLFNTILLTWLGLTVLLNSDRRTWGIWLASGALLLGGAFFTSHTAVLGLGLARLNRTSLIFWWIVGLVPAIILPYAWYVVVLWYAGFWNSSPSPLYTRQKRWLFFVTGLVIGGLVMLALGTLTLAVPSPQLFALRQFLRWSIVGIPLLGMSYSFYVILCLVLSLDALQRPGPSRRIMGQLARQRARPWMVTATIVLLAVSLLVASVVLWVVQAARERPFTDVYLSLTNTITLFDLIISALVALAVFLIGQAVVSYEIFTGKTLPRRGLARHWRRAVFLAAGMGVVIGGIIAFEWRPVYSLLLTALLIAVFYALFSWQSYLERERYIANLRPFMTSNRLYEQLLTAVTTPTTLDLLPPFTVLCRDILGAKLAYLVPIGPLAPLINQPLRYPPHNTASLPPLTELANLSATSNTPGQPLPLNATEYGGAIWAVPLWSERGLIGFFLLGEKADGGLYTQEEIEIARVSGERLIDTQASTEISRRLMTLQRERMAQTQVIDQQTRRVLHDEILPTLQTVMIALTQSEAGENGRLAQAVRLLTDAHRQISDLLHHMPTTVVPEVNRLGLITALKKAVSQEFAASFDEVVWDIPAEVSERTRQLSPLTAEVVYYAAREVVRNAARYGRGSGNDANGTKRPFRLHISAHWQNGLILCIEDNGVGFRAQPINRGSGQGLALHSTLMAVVGGALTIDSHPGQWTRVTLQTAPPLPASASSA
ncbi:MAG: hypothetical protein D6706_09190 [Chloroflexi bacterium]|nr:MAG: hypothetical protein D6706_09190 [Chloroflexota bacterium]